MRFASARNVSWHEWSGLGMSFGAVGGGWERLGQYHGETRNGKVRRVSRMVGHRYGLLFGE